jgi:hypothetical protein
MKDAFRPEYSQLPKRLRLSGSVRVGSYDRPGWQSHKAHLVGGHPVLAESAEKAAALLTRIETGPKQTTQIIDYRFEPPDK